MRAHGRSVAAFTSHLVSPPIGVTTPAQMEFAVALFVVSSLRTATMGGDLAERGCRGSSPRFTSYGT